ncbi:hypothetical protein [Demequina aurantiaca]|uniref:hypothetical protein n=1 Tax=Demequina aurantiaca TaxID=676200 RepID=UPI0007850771|nr:hypothetical protein [Demequina aurantiaca]
MHSPIAADATVVSDAPRVLSRAKWEPLQDLFHARVDAATCGHRERRDAGESHAVEDFLYEYNSTKPSQLRRWHPGPGIVLQEADAQARWKWYRTQASAAGVMETTFDAAAFMAKRGTTVDFVENLMKRTAERPLHVGCFGLHEWAMIYKSGDPDRRHTLPLRLGREGTDAVVEAHPIACTHFDAFRFFTPEARPLNATQLTRETQVASEQPGCLHATMDLFKWCLKLSPAVPSELQQDCFDLALEVRRVDMRASPYNVSSYGLEAIAIETPAGKAEYATMQREFARRGADLRLRIVDACQAIRATA